MLHSRRRRLDAGRVLAALVILLGSTQALAHQHLHALDEHPRAVLHAHGPDCDHAHVAPPVEERHGHGSDDADCSVCWAGAVAGKALATPPLLHCPPLGAEGVGPCAAVEAPRLKKVRAAFEARGPPVKAGF